MSLSRCVYKKVLFLYVVKLIAGFSLEILYSKKGFHDFETPELMGLIHNKGISVGCLFFKVEISLVSFSQDKD